MLTKAETDEEITQLQNITEAAQKMLVRELRQPYLGRWFSLRGIIKKHINLTGEAREILRRIIRQRQVSAENHGDLLDMLLSAQYEDGSLIVEEQLIDEILILFTEGRETTSNALTFIFQLLALHLEWLELIYKESQTIGKAKDWTIKIREAKICQQVIEEAIRLYPLQHIL